MGIFILPFLLGAVAVFLFSATRLYQLIVNQEATLVYFLFGLLLAALLYGSVLYRYVVKKRYWALSPLFTFPIFQFILPFGLAMITNYSQNSFIRGISFSLQISIVFSGLFFVIFKDLTFKILDKLGIKKYY